MSLLRVKYQTFSVCIDDVVNLNEINRTIKVKTERVNLLTNKKNFISY